MNKIVIFGLICIFSRHIDALCTGEELKAVEADCVAANGGDATMVERFLNAARTTNKDEKCFRYCLLEHCGYFDASDNFVQGKYKEYLDAFAGGDAAHMQALRDVFDACEKLKPDADKCNTAEKFLECVADNFKDIKVALARLL